MCVGLLFPHLFTKVFLGPAYREVEHTVPRSLFLYKLHFGYWVYKKNNIMGFFSFNSEFEVTVNHPKEEAFESLRSYVEESWSIKLTKAEKFEKLFFTKGMTLLSLPIDFEVSFEEIDKNNTMLSVKTESGTMDFGKAKGMFNDIVKKIY